MIPGRMKHGVTGEKSFADRASLGLVELSMKSDDPSPWAEGDYDEPIMSTSVMLKEAEADRAAADREAERN